MPVVGRPAAPAPWDPSAPCASVVLLFFSAAAGPASYELRVCVCVSAGAGVRAMFSSSAMFSCLPAYPVACETQPVEHFQQDSLGLGSARLSMSPSLAVKGFLLSWLLSLSLSLCCSAVAWHMFNAQLFWSCCAFPNACVRVWVIGLVCIQTKSTSSFQNNAINSQKCT